MGELSVTTPCGRLTGGRIGSRRDVYVCGSPACRGRLLLSLLAA